MCLSQLLLQNRESKRLDSFTGWINRLKDLSKTEKVAMEARRRGKNIQGRVYFSSSGTEEHTLDLKWKQWLDRSYWNTSWMSCSHLRCWHHVGMVASLTLAGGIGLFHAWYVYSIHENLLWFSQLEVRRTSLKCKFVELWL